MGINKGKLREIGQKEGNRLLKNSRFKSTVGETNSQTPRGHREEWRHESQ